MRHTSAVPKTYPSGNPFNFGQTAGGSRKNQATVALELVHQAAEVLNEIENRASETTARAHSLVKSAIDKLQLAQRRIDSVENARLATLNEAAAQIREATNTLKQAESRAAGAEARASAAQSRAEAAEARANEAETALRTIEEAIRTQLLGAQHSESILAAAA